MASASYPNALPVAAIVQRLTMAKATEHHRFWPVAWMQANWLRTKRIAYWGDLDTWGLAMLATARVHQPKLDALLMDWQTFDAHAALAVPEPHPASELPPDALSHSERALYLRLRQAKKGRLEQEFLPREAVVAQLSGWRSEVAVHSRLDWEM